jgi:cystathionine gamma-synthase
MERNSRDFVLRNERINSNAEAIFNVLHSHPRGIVSPDVRQVVVLLQLTEFACLVKQVYYPKYSPTRAFYDRCRTPTGGYGGLLSVTFFVREHAVTFFDNLNTAKGPSLGTNFTLRLAILSSQRVR